MRERSLHLFALVAALMLLLPDRASAYIDPGAGSILLQGLLGVLAGGVALGSVYWHKVRAFFSRASESDAARKQ